MAAALSFAFTVTPVPAATTYVVEATRQVSAGISFLPRSEYKFIGSVAAAGASPLNALAAYNALYGALIAGRKIFWRMRAFSTASGFVSEPLYGVSIVA